ncbi:hypothetical protein [Stenotrophomonas sp. PS02289]|uniref:hypothetical protein n=1 Tax=Stenotrophomonas sp. PS02289 TaxID=2991422 RepID=UPI002499E005|nr:hypothetical protein [Stenotrophomonas sp. PS02289]
MIVPEYWAEAIRDTRHKGRRLVVRRFGWSDDSVAAAQAHAELRVQEALDTLLQGQDVPRRERLTNYGVDGVPIREQIVERQDDLVITRNSYGALCLNTPNVLFADIDHPPLPTTWALSPVLTVVLWSGLWVLGANLLNGTAGFLLAAVVVIALNALMLRRTKRNTQRRAQLETQALARVERFSAKHPDWHLRTYRTPAGLRVLVMHATFSPHDDEVQQLFAALHTDKLYMRMCRVQHCFRARLTPKPWRVGVRRRIRPPFAAWSAEQAFRPDRLQWIAEYERRARGHAACSFLRAYGNEAQVDAKAEVVRAVHDRMTQAYASLPLA